MKYDPMLSGCRCDICPLRGNKVVPPSGAPDAIAVVIGEGPGYQEEQNGRPFIGPSGLMLDEMLRHTEVKRERLWITNTLLCRARIPRVKGPHAYSLPDYITWLRKVNKDRKRTAHAEKRVFEPVPSPLDCCKPRLLRELAWFERVAIERKQPNGAVVLALGNFALEAVTGHKGIMKYRGSPLRIDLGVT